MRLALEKLVNDDHLLNSCHFAQDVAFFISRPAVKRSGHGIRCGTVCTEIVHAHEIIPRLNTVDYWPADFSCHASHTVFAVIAHAENKPHTIKVIRRPVLPAARGCTAPTTERRARPRFDSKCNRKVEHIDLIFTEKQNMCGPFRQLTELLSWSIWLLIRADAAWAARLHPVLLTTPVPQPPLAS